MVLLIKYKIILDISILEVSQKIPKSIPTLGQTLTKSGYEGAIKATEQVSAQGAFLTSRGTVRWRC